MLFTDILQKKRDLLTEEFDKLFDEVLNKQAHIGDLLLVSENGSYKPNHITNPAIPKMSPFIIGPLSEGHSFNDHYDFIHKYRTSAVANLSHEEYLEKLKWDPERSVEIEKAVDDESFTIQMEMLIFLKVWEADYFIKQLYQIVRLLKGEPYDWQFSIAVSNRDKEATGTREKIIRNKIRDPLEQDFPNIYKAIKDTYKTQIRNSIAHSNYSFQNRNIHLNNKIDGDPHNQLVYVEFDEWIDLFHNTMVIYNQLLRKMNDTRLFYADFESKHGGYTEIKTTVKKRDEEGKDTEEVLYYALKYDKKRNRWSWFNPSKAK